MPERKLRVFLCHASQDKPVVRELYQRLNAEGWIDPWLDEEKLLPGQDWDMEIEKAVEAADAVIVCLSTNSVTKEGYIQKELRKALDVADEKPEGTIFIIPLRFNDCQVPRSLAKWQWIDFFPTRSKKLALARLLQSLRERANILSRKVLKTSTPTPTGFQVFPFGEIEFVNVPKGDFLMGSKSNDSTYLIEQPQHVVNIPYDYWIGRFPVTNAQYAEYAESTDGSTLYSFHERNWEYKLNHPFYFIFWDSLLYYLRWINNSYHRGLPKGYIFRLPTEAEWEKAARGSDGRKWPWGNKFDEEKCNCLKKHSYQNRTGTTPVGAYSPQGDSPYGCADMYGNVWEWTNTIYKNYPYDPTDGRERDDNDNLDIEEYEMITRGVSWEDARDRVQVTCRRGAVTGEHSHINEYTGFRLVVGPPIAHVIKLMRK